MLIIFGVRKSKIKEKDVKGRTVCPNCSASNSYKVSGSASYFHLFWIITFPLRKRLVFVCKSCDDVIRPHHKLPIRLEDALSKNPIRRPKWHFTGVFIVFVFVLLGVIGWVIGRYHEYEYRMKEAEYEAEIERGKSLLIEDIKLAQPFPDFEKDSISNKLLKTPLFSEYNLDTQRIALLSKVKNNRLMLIVNFKENQFKNYLKRALFLNELEEYLFRSYKTITDAIYVVYCVNDVVSDVLGPYRSIYENTLFGESYRMEAFYNDSIKIHPERVEDFKEKRMLVITNRKGKKKPIIDSLHLVEAWKKMSSTFKFKFSQEPIGIKDYDKFLFIRNTGMTMPDELRYMMQFHNGEGPFLNILSVTNRLNSQKSGFEDGSLKEIGGSYYQSIVDSTLLDQEQKIVPLVKNPNWIVFYDDMTYVYAIDYLPGKNGKMGQILLLEPKSERKVVATDMLHFLRLYKNKRIPMSIKEWSDLN